MSIKPNVANPIRTAGQLVPAAVVTELLDVFVVDFDDRGYAAVLGGLTLLFSYVQNTIETLKGRALLKENPAD